MAHANRIWVLMGLVLFVTSASAAASPAQLDTPRFEPTPCPVNTPAGVECGYLIVPEDRSSPAASGRTLSLAVAILKSRSQNPAPDPVVYLRGGPGESPLKLLDTLVDSPFRDRRDLIIFGYRGTQYSEPWLDCPELQSALYENFTRALSDEAEIASEVQAAARCRDRLLAQGINLSTYHSSAIAADLDDLRRTLGYNAINLYGVSYGTRVALTAMRDHPEGIRSVVLDSVYTPDHRLLADLIPQVAGAAELLFARCAADPHCNDAYPALKDEFNELLDRTNAEPLRVVVRRPGTGEALRAVLTGGDIAALIVSGIEQTYALPYIPYLIHQLHQGNSDTIIPLLESGLQGLAMFSNGMHYSVECYERAPFNSPDDILDAKEAFPHLSNFYLYRAELAICEVWPSGRAGLIESQPVVSSIPTLILSGEYDPATPASRAEAAALSLPHSFRYTFPGMGHAVTYIPGCAQNMAVAFVNDPATPPDATCISALRQPGFIADSELINTLAVYDLIGRPDIVWLVLLAIGVLFFGSVMVLGPISLIRALRRPASQTLKSARIARIVEGVAAILNLAFLVGTALVIANKPDLMVALMGLMFGLPAQALPLLIIPLATAILTIGSLIFAARAWRDRYWTWLGRIHYTLVALSAAVFTGWLGYWVWRSFWQ